MWKAMASKGRVQEAIDQMLALEKQTRTVRIFFLFLPNISLLVARVEEYIRLLSNEWPMSSLGL